MSSLTIKHCSSPSSKFLSKIQHKVATWVFTNANKKYCLALITVHAKAGNPLGCK